MQVENVTMLIFWRIKSHSQKHATFTHAWNVPPVTANVGLITNVLCPKFTQFLMKRNWNCLKNKAKQKYQVCF